MKIRTVTLIFTAGLLAACSGGLPKQADGQPLIGALSRLQCGGANWYQVGLFDGGTGYEQPQRFASISNQCRSHGFKPDKEAYERGLADGMAGRS